MNAKHTTLNPLFEGAVPRWLAQGAQGIRIPVLFPSEQEL